MGEWVEGGVGEGVIGRGGRGGDGRVGGVVWEGRGGVGVGVY